ncbi:MAG TPA: hypothetical protein VHM30_18705, partial [Gemmatimonadaceae bacterium]|nr:hypothetical protein [Gemmatimonadaceae bacterium]
LRILAYDAAPRHWLRLGVLGALAVWFSQPALFILAGIALALAVAVARRRIPLRWPAVVACILWLVSGVPSIWVTLHSLAPRERLYMRSFWSDGFWPLPPRSLADLAWPFENLYGIFRDPLGMPVTAFGLGIFILGVIVLARRRPVALAALVAPLGIIYVASALRIYPFDTTVEGFNKIAAANGRVLLFLVPGLILVLVEGVMALVVSPLAWVRRFGYASAALLVGAPLYYATAALPYSPQDLRPVFRAMEQGRRDGDALYVAYGARQAFEWYRDRIPFPDSAITLGGCHRPAWREYMREVDAFRGRGRLWVMVSHPAAIHGLREMVLLEEYLDRIAPKLGRWGSKDAFVLLYDMSRVAPPPGPPAGWHPGPRRLAFADTITIGWSCMGVFPGPGVPGTVVSP